MSEAKPIVNPARLLDGFRKCSTHPTAKNLTTILLTQRMFDDAKPAPIFEQFEQDARKLVG